MTCHGWSDNSELQEINNIELSRRGYVVLSIDMYGHGDSDDVEADSWWKEENAGNGIYDGVRALASLPYVDKKQIGITGHSNGGYASNITVLLDNEADEQLIAAVLINCSDAFYTENIYYGEWYPESDTRFTNWYGNRDAGMIAARKEEVFHRLHLNNGTLTTPEQFIEQQTAQSFLHFGQNPDGLAKRDSGKVYTETIDGRDAFRVIYTPNINHVMGFFSSRASQCVIEFFTRTFKAPNPIAPDNQIWQWKVLFSTFGVAGFFLFLVAFILVMLETKEFSMLKAEQPLVISCWSLACGAFTCLFLWLNYRKYAKGSGLNLRQRGAVPDKNRLWKSILLGAAAAISAYCLVFLAEYLFQVDFRFWFIIVLRAFDSEKIPEILKYLPFLWLFYAAQSVAVNVFQFIKVGKKEWVNTFILAIFSVLGPVILLAAGYGCFLVTGLLPLDAFGFGTGSMLLWLYPMLFMLPAFTVISRILYKATDNPYIAATAFSLVAAITLCTNAMSVL